MFGVTVRSIAELEDYAKRLHEIDPKAIEPIPVSAEEAFAVQEHVIKTKPWAREGLTSVFDLHLGGHKLKIL